MFFPVEQEVGRAVAARASSGNGIAPVLRRACVAAGALAAGLALTTLALSQPLLHHVFDDQVLVVLGFGASLFGYAAVHLTRGILSGTGRFRAYALLLGGEGTLRLAFGIALLGFGVRTAGPLALVVGLAPLAAVAMTLSGQRGVMTPGSPAPWTELSRSLGLLLLGSLLSQVLIHAGPLAVKLLVDDDSKELTSKFFAAVLLTRVPLFLFFAVQAALLPRLAAFVTQEDRPGFCQTLNRLLTVVVALGAASIAGASLFGQQAVEVLFGSAFLLDDRGLALLAGSTAAIMVAQSLGQALVALEGQAVAALCWLLGVLGFVAVTAIGNDVLLRVELGLVTGAVVAAAAMAIALRGRLDNRLPPATPEDGSTRSARSSQVPQSCDP